MITETWQTDALGHLTDAGLIVERSDTDSQYDVRADAVLRVASPPLPEPYLVQFKRRASLTTVPSIGRELRHRLLIVAPYIPESLAGLWRSQGIQYVDAAGNMYLRAAGLLLDVRGRRPQSHPKPLEGNKPLRAFKPSGIKILFVLLAFPEIITANYRNIGQASGTSLGTVQWVLTELEKIGHLRAGPSGKRLYRVRELFNRWVEAYVLDLYPRLTLARFDAPNPLWWVNAGQFLRLEGAQWGGETAAHFLNPHLQPATAILYASAIPQRLALQYRFRDAGSNGNVEVRQRFWQYPDPEAGDSVPNLLIYADMIASADPRQLEAADHFRMHDESIGRLDQT